MELAAGIHRLLPIRSVDRRRALRALVLGALAPPAAILAQPAAGVRRVGWLTLVKNYGPSENLALNLVRATLAELGWVEGRNIAIEPRWAENDRTVLPALAAELVRLPVDVMVTQGDTATLAAVRATSEIPIVMTGINDPERLGVVASLARPGGNVTGVTNGSGPAFYRKMAQLLKQAAPNVSRLAVVGTEERVAQALESAAGTLGLAEIIRAPASTHHEMQAALGVASRARADSLLALATSVNDPNRQAIVDFALAHRWPSIGGDRLFARYGGLMSYWTDWPEIRRRTAIYVDRILRGSKPADLPIVQPDKFLLVLNLRTAAALGLALGRELRYRADELIG